MEEFEMTQIARLIIWLEANGHSADEITECIKYISGIQKPNVEQKEIGSPEPTTAQGA